MSNDDGISPPDYQDQLDGLQRQIDSLANQLQSISDAVVERLDSEQTTQPKRWEDLTAGEARAQWEQLRAWVTWLRGRYVLDLKTLPWCWYLHGALVEELGALWTGHVAAYRADAHPGSPAAWHDTLARTLPRLREWAERSGCRPGEHHDDITQDPGEPAAAWQEQLARLAQSG